MYATHSARPKSAHSAAVVTVIACALALGGSTSALAQFQSPTLMRKLTGQTEKLELTTNSSRILTLDKNIPRVQVNNPDLLAVTPLSANQVQISAKKAGVTQVNLWDEDGNIHTVDVLIYGDVQELQVALQTQYPNSAIKVYRYSESLVLKGFVDQPEHVSQIVQLASDYAPKVINNITVGGVQQVLLKVRVMEVSRTKLRQMGNDFAFRSGNGGVVASSVSGLIASVGTNVGTAQPITTVGTAGGQTFQFGIVSGNNSFFDFLDMLQERRVAKVLAEPNIVAVSGRPAQFQVGGEFPILVPQSLGTTSIEFKPYGTQVDFLPIVLGNGSIRLEVRPRISDIDPALSVRVNGLDIPALTVRQVDTAVEMRAGQTFALAGLVQERTESVNRGLPYVSDIPFFGVPFRKTKDNVNEIELLVMVTPEFVDAMDPCEAPCGGPGYATTSPDNCDLFCGGHIEVPAHCNPIRGMTACGECSEDCGCGPSSRCGCNGPMTGPVESIITDGGPLPGGTGYDDTYEPNPMQMNAPEGAEMSPDSVVLPPDGAGEEPLPPQSSNQPVGPAFGERQASRPPGQPEYTVPRQYSPERQPVFVRNSTSPQNPHITSEPAESPELEGGLIGPVGYDAQ